MLDWPSHSTAKELNEMGDERWNVLTALTPKGVLELEIHSSDSTDHYEIHPVRPFQSVSVDRADNTNINLVGLATPYSLKLLLL